MHRRTTTAAVMAAMLAASSGSSVIAHAQQPPDSAARRTKASIDSLTAALKALEARLDSATTAGAQAAAPAAAPQPRAASGSYMNISFDGLTDAGWSSQKNVRTLQRGDHDPKVRGFSIPNAEIALDGTVDPYFKGFSNIVLKLDQSGETGIELEEMYVVSTSLPHNLQVKAGQFFTEFGRQNPQHPHAWSFVDQPLVMNRMLGGEGLRSQGARVSWLVPTKFYTEAMVTIANATGGTTYSFNSPDSPEIHGGAVGDRDINGMRDLLIAPRITSSFDPTSNQTVLVGASAAFGPNNSGPRANTQIYGADVYWKWKSPTAAQGFPFVSLQTEAMMRSYDAAPRAADGAPDVQLIGETLKDRGVYSQLLWGIKPLIVAGLRGDYVSGDQASFTSELRADRTRVSPNLTWYPSEYSKLRLQYNFDHRKGLGNDSSLWLQFEFMIGAHSAHKF